MCHHSKNWIITHMKTLRCYRYNQYNHEPQWNQSYLMIFVPQLVAIPKGGPPRISAIQQQDRCGGCDEVLIQDVQGHSAGVQHGSMHLASRSHQGHQGKGPGRAQFQPAKNIVVFMRSMGELAIEPCSLDNQRGNFSGQCLGEIRGCL